MLTYTEGTPIAQSGDEPNQVPDSGLIDNTEIAYIASSQDNQQIRTIRLDGTDRLVWEMADDVDHDKRLGTLTWKPDSSEIAFTSGHDWHRSMFVQDVYGISADGNQLRRITSPPHPDQLDPYPTGGVQFVVDTLGIGQSEIYIEGAHDFLAYFSAPGMIYTITFDETEIGDLGENVLQEVRLIHYEEQDPEQFECRYGEASGSIEIIAGEITQQGTIFFWNTRQCEYAFEPTWLYDGSGLLYIDVSGDFYQLDDFPPPATEGRLVYDYNFSDLHRGASTVVMAPTADRQDEYLLIGQGGRYDAIYHGSTDNLNDVSLVSNQRCTVDDVLCRVLGLAWLPDGSGFVYALHGNVTRSKLYEYNFETGQSTELLQLTDQFIGRLAVAPDGSAIAYEVSDEVTALYSGVARLDCLCSIWVVDRDGSNARELVADGRAPSWSRGEPVAQAPPEATSTATPSTAPTTSPTATPSPTANVTATPRPTDESTPSAPDISNLSPSTWIPLLLSE